MYGRGASTNVDVITIAHAAQRRMPRGLMYENSQADEQRTLL